MRICKSDLGSLRSVWQEFFKGVILGAGEDVEKSMHSLLVAVKSVTVILEDSLAKPINVYNVSALWLISCFPEN